MAYRSLIFRAHPPEFDEGVQAGGAYNGVCMHTPWFQIHIANFDQQLATMREEIGMLQEAHIDGVRCNHADTIADYQADAGSAAARSVLLRNHYGVFATELTNAGMWLMVSLLDRMWGLDRDATVRAALDAAGPAMFGANPSLYWFTEGITDDSFGDARDNTRRWLLNAWMFGDGGTLTYGTAGAKPGPNASGPLADALHDAIGTWVIANVTDFLTRMGWVFGGGAQTKNIWLQAFNGDEFSRSLTIDPWWPQAFSYFSDGKYNMKNPNVITYINANFSDLYMPQIDATYTTLAALDSIYHQRAEWAVKVLSDIAYGNQNATNVILDQCRHKYWDGQHQPRSVGNPASDKMTETNNGRRFDPFTEPRSGTNPNRSTDQGNDDEDMDEAFWIQVLGGTAVELYMEGEPDFKVTLPSNANSTQVRDTLLALPGIGDLEPFVDEIRATIEKQWTLRTPIHTYFDNPPTGLVVNGYHVRMGHILDPATGAASTTTNSKSKARKFLRIRSDDPEVVIHQVIRGGEVDRGPSLIWSVKQSIEVEGARLVCYHTPIDPESTFFAAADGSTINQWIPALYEAWRAGAGKPRKVHDAGPMFLDEPLHWKFCFKQFGRLVKSYRS